MAQHPLPNWPDAATIAHHYRDVYGPNAVVDPIHAQITDFEYFAVGQMFQRLEHLGRQDQIEDLPRRLATRRRQEPPPFPSSRY